MVVGTVEETWTSKKLIFSEHVWSKTVKGSSKSKTVRYI